MVKDYARSIDRYRAVDPACSGPHNAPIFDLPLSELKNAHRDAPEGNRLGLAEMPQATAKWTGTNDFGCG